MKVRVKFSRIPLAMGMTANLLRRRVGPKRGNLEMP